MYSVSCDAGVFLIFPEDVSGRVSENNQDTRSSLRWIFSSLLSVLSRCSSGLIPTPGVTTESVQTLAMISVNQQLKVNSRCDQFQYGKKCRKMCYSEWIEIWSIMLPPCIIVYKAIKLMNVFNSAGPH